MRKLLLAMAGIVLFASPPVAKADDAPPDIEAMLQQFNKENGILGGSSPEGPEVEEDVVDFFGIKTYDKSRT